jgi:hypothetical protein
MADGDLESEKKKFELEFNENLEIINDNLSKFNLEKLEKHITPKEYVTGFDFLWDDDDELIFKKVFEAINQMLFLVLEEKGFSLLGTRVSDWKYGLKKENDNFILDIFSSPKVLIIIPTIKITNDKKIMFKEYFDFDSFDPIEEIIEEKWIEITNFNQFKNAFKFRFEEN